jgi:hypothetical protein
MIFKQWSIDMRARLAALFRRREIYHRTDEELQFRLAMLEQRMIESGMSSDDARVLARRQLGNTTLITEQTPEAWRYTFVDTLIRDFRYAVRTLVKNISFSATAVLTLALGIGATTAIFSVVYSVLIKPLPYPNAEELVRPAWRSRHQHGSDFLTDDVFHVPGREPDVGQYRPVAGGLRDADWAR